MLKSVDSINFSFNFFKNLFFFRFFFYVNLFLLHYIDIMFFFYRNHARNYRVQI